jgi:hypothetical protein
MVRTLLNQTFPGRWIGRGKPLAWPVRSQDLSPLDFFLRGHLRSVVYTKKPTDIANLKQKTTDEIRVLTIDQLQNVNNQIIERLPMLMPMLAYCDQLSAN